MITLGIDTCEARGSVAVRREGTTWSVLGHETGEDYSSWLLPAVEKCLFESSTTLQLVDVVAVATGPGSFTGLRVGITTAKAWAELYALSLVGVSRLEVMACAAETDAAFVAASFDAQRGQIFGGLYRVGAAGARSLVDQEMVVGATEFVRWVGETVGKERVHWVTLDPGLIESAESWKARAAQGESVLVCRNDLAPQLAQLGEERARKGELSDALDLDANYVRRSDAEIFWKGASIHEH